MPSINKYRKKPIVIEAVRWDGEDDDGFFEMLTNWGCRFDVLRNVRAILVQGLEGDMRCDFGSVIIKGTVGEFYTSKNLIFEATYDKVKD